MERVTLPNIVKFAKQLSETRNLYRPGMEIRYPLEQNTYDLLQYEVYVHMNKSDNGYKETKTFEFEIMDIRFVFNRVIG